MNNIIFEHNLELLISKSEIEKKIEEVAKKLNEEYKKEELSVIGIMNGSIFFFADLIRQLNIPIQIDTIVASSYHGTQSINKVIFHKKIVKPIIENKNVIVIEDAIDTGLTLTKIYEYLIDLKPKKLEIITMVDKIGCHPNFKYPYKSLFNVNEKFIVGYGLDMDGLYRQLDQIYKINL